jgi:hypothetical protein
MVCYSDIVILFVGAIIGVFVSLAWNYFNDLVFGLTILRQRKGKYRIALKNGMTLKSIKEATITGFSGRKLTFNIDSVDIKNGSAIGEIVFVSKNYGKGFYKHKKSDLYGLFEFILLPEGKISVIRRYTTDVDNNKRISSQVVETSFIWEKLKNRP